MFSQQNISQRPWIMSLIVAVLAMGFLTSSARADISQQAVNRAGRYLQTTSIGKDVLSFVHFGSTYHSHEFVRTTEVTDGTGSTREGYFALVYKFSWEDDGVTEVAFLCDRDGNVYRTQVVSTNAVLQQPFAMANLTIKAVAGILENTMSDNWTAKDRADFHKLVDAADAHGLLDLYLRLNQPSR